MDSQIQIQRNVWTQGLSRKKRIPEDRVNSQMNTVVEAQSWVERFKALSLGGLEGLLNGVQGVQLVLVVGTVYMRACTKFGGASVRRLKLAHPLKKMWQAQRLAVKRVLRVLLSGTLGNWREGSFRRETGVLCQDLYVVDFAGWLAGMLWKVYCSLS